MSFLSQRKAESLIQKMQHNAHLRRTSGTSSGFSANSLFLLRKPCHLRGELDLLTIEKDLRRQVWIEKLPPETTSNKDAFRDLIRVLSLREYKGGTVLEEAGKTVDTMYVVVRGGLQSVHIIEDDETDEREEHVFKRFRPGEVAGHEFLDMMVDWTTTLKVECDGTELIRIQKYEYHDALEVHESRTVTERAAFLKCVPPFSRWAEEERVNLARLLKVEHYPSNVPIVRQGGVPKKFFIIFQGYCRILKEVAVPCKSLTILRAPLELHAMSHSSGDPHPISVKRRPVTADNHSGRSRNFGAASFRCPMWRESLPRAHRWDLMEGKALHTRPFTVSTPARKRAPRLDEDTSSGQKPPRTKSRTPWSRPQITTEQESAGQHSPRPAKSQRRRSTERSGQSDTPKTPRRNQCRLVHDFHGDELEGSKKVIMELKELWRGQFFGEQGIINKSVNSATVVTSSAVQLLVLSKLDFCRLQQDTGEGARELNAAAQTRGYRNDTEDIVEAMKGEFRWSNFRHDTATDSIFGNRFAHRALAAGITGWSALDDADSIEPPQTARF